MSGEWQGQLKNFVNSVTKLKQYINLTAEEEKILTETQTTWGTTPYFASLMDRDDPNCPLRRQVIPSLHEHENRFGMQDYLLWKENRTTEEQRPDSIARQYRDRVPSRSPRPAVSIVATVSVKNWWSMVISSLISMLMKDCSGLPNILKCAMS